jgi:two-component system, OmpR family, sensor histidine kinase MtrB
MLRPPSPTTLVADLKRVWRSSLQVRVVTITLATSGALVLTFGLVVGNMINSGLLATQADRARDQVDAGGEYAKEWLSTVSTARDPSLTQRTLSVVAELANRVQASGADVAILPGEPGMQLVRGYSSPNQESYTRVPEAFQAAVRREQYVSQRLGLDLGGPGGEKLYLVFGHQMTLAWGDTLELYYFFPLDDEVRQAALVGSTITLTGLTLVVMLALVAYLVTRMVVSPVRVAARTAQRLSNGLLDQRMEVKGEDDLAALAASFNQMAENLQRHILRLEDMSRLQRRFTSDVSHELRTPLTTVRMAADLIFSHRDDYPPPVARSAELLQTELDRFEGLLTELLEISRFDAGFAALDPEPANLGPLVRRAVDRLEPLAERAGVSVEVDLPAEPVIADVDVRRVERILRNLIGNAIEHGEGKPVKVRLRAREGAVAITVRDHGVGLKPGEEKLVFNRFWRADPARARHTGGTGLGLSISAEDARLHGGWLDAWGLPGQGAQFRLTLPVVSGATLTSSPLRLAPRDTTPGALAAHIAAGAPMSIAPASGPASAGPASDPVSIAPASDPAAAPTLDPASAVPTGSSAPSPRRGEPDETLAAADGGRGGG